MEETDEAIGKQFLTMINTLYKTHGMDGLKDAINADVDKWKTAPLNIGVIGKVNSGKSSFINALRRLEYGDEGYADVDVEECTEKVRQYPHPQNKMLVFHDCPGEGTQNFPSANYLKVIGADTFDVLLFITATSFTQDEVSVAKDASELGKLMLFVRTKVDIDLQNDEKQKRKYWQHSKAEATKRVFDKIRETCLKNISPVFEPEVNETEVNTSLYLINNFDQYDEKFDFQKLTDRICFNFSDLKREALVLSLGAFTERKICEMHTILKTRALKIGVVSGIAGAVPFLGAVIDVSLIVRELEFYRRQLGLEKRDITIIARRAGVSVDELVYMTGLRSISFELSFQGLRAISVAFGAINTFTFLTNFIFHGIGSIFTAPYSCYASTNFLLKALHAMVEDAMTLRRMDIKSGPLGISNRRVCAAV